VCVVGRVKVIGSSVLGRENNISETYEWMKAWYIEENKIGSFGYSHM
jgi:hypothetical protein